MALNQKTTSQQKRPKTTNCFLACFGIHPKTTNNNNNSSTTLYKKKPTKFGVRKKFFSKLCWPKFKTINVDNFNKKKKNFKFDASKTAVLRASHNIMLEATKVHHQQFKMIDHHHASKSISTKEPILLPYKESTHLEDYQSRPSHGATCYTKDNDHTPKAAVLKQQQQQPLFVDKVTKDYSLIGASIMVAMLIILSIWGRLCAILCMCGWLYCIPFLRGDNKEVIITSSNNDMNTKMSIHFNPNLNTKMNIDFNSELYKKKVVLDGLLQRNHQNVVGIT